MSESKIGYSDIGGIYIGKNLVSDFLNNHTITIILSLGKPFRIAFKSGASKLYSAAIIQKDVQYRLQSSKFDYVTLIHLDPYSDIGIKLTQKENSIQKLEINAFSDVLEEFRIWFINSESNECDTKHLLEKTCTIIAKKNVNPVKIDDRILKSIQWIKEKDVEKLSVHQVADLVHLSPSYFAYLFKREMGMTFRQFVLHRKLIKSLNAIHQQNNLTESAFLGGFSDQPHFTRTFKRAFGIKPSSTKK